MIPDHFTRALEDYLPRIQEAHRRGLHHDQRRAFLVEFLRQGFRIPVEEIELEKDVRAARLRGYIDALYRSLVIEMKRDLEAERAKGIEELGRYLRSTGGEGSFGLLTDGLTFEVYLATRGTLQRVHRFTLVDQPPETVYRHLDAYLFSAKTIVPTAEEITLRFGEPSPVFAAALDRLRTLFEGAQKVPAVAVKYQEWERLLAKVYGSAVGDPSLFLRHTYLAALARLLAFLAVRREAPTGDDIPGILTGETFRRLGLTNLAEEDFFCWLLEPDLRAEGIGLLQGMVQHLGALDVTKVDEDLLKELYQQLVDPQTRHDLGEFYTPDWLAELTLEQAGFRPGQRLLDPACGSGTFLFTAIRRLAAHGLEGAKLIEAAVSNVVGMDVHPLAVAISRANYVLALASALRQAKRDVSIPVYMANSLLRIRKRTYISVPVEADQEFALPVDLASQPELLDRIIEALVSFAQRAEPLPTLTAGFKAWLAEQGIGWDFPWPTNLRLMRDVVRGKRDTVWAFILRNAYRPFFLANHPFDLVAGNPPWLAYRYIQTKEYQADVKELSVKSYGLIEPKEVKLFTHMDTSALFFALSADRYLQEGGTIAFVMPRSVLTGAKQYARFRGMRFGSVSVGLRRILDLEGVTPLFNVPACVLIGNKGTKPSPEVPMTVYAGELARKNLPWAEAQGQLRTRTTRYRRPAAGAASPYYDRFLQGATIVPRSLWFVHPPGVKGGAVDRRRPYLETDPEMAAEGKRPWKGLKIGGNVEAQFLYATALNKDLFPFLARFRLVVLPLVVRRKGRAGTVVDRAGAVREGAVGLAAWLEQAEKLWKKNKKSTTKESVYKWLDYRQKLSSQTPRGPYKVIYNAAGTNLVAAVVEPGAMAKGAMGLPVQGFLAEHKTYVYETENPEEAHYLAAVLNSPTVNQAIKPFQTRGQFGARDIERRPLEVVPIPVFDTRNPLHRRLAELGAQCQTKAAKALATGVKGGLVKIRAVIRETISQELEEIDETVRRLVANPGSQNGPPARLGQMEIELG